MQRYGPMMRQFAAMYHDNSTLAAQLNAATVIAEEFDSNSSGGHLKFTVSTEIPAVDVDTVDAIANDADGMAIDIIMHFVGGRLSWGEWYRVDGQPIQTWPPAAIRKHLG